MNFFLEDLPVFFPFSLLYKEQLEYMTEIKHSLDMNVVFLLSYHSFPS
jgi:hypothetical protein